jgi:putative endonuclease
VTSNLARRVYEHKIGEIEGFTKKYDLKTLVYYEAHNDIEEAILREKRIKRWRRDWKIDLIHQNNWDWKDLYEELNN